MGGNVLSCTSSRTLDDDIKNSRPKDRNNKWQMSSKQRKKQKKNNVYHLTGLGTPPNVTPRGSPGDRQLSQQPDIVQEHIVQTDIYQESQEKKNGRSLSTTVIYPPPKPHRWIDKSFSTPCHDSNTELSPLVEETSIKDWLESDDNAKTSFIREDDAVGLNVKQLGELQDIQEAVVVNVEDDEQMYTRRVNLERLQSTEVSPELSPMSKTYPRHSVTSDFYSSQDMLDDDPLEVLRCRQILTLTRDLLIDKMIPATICRYLNDRNVLSILEAQNIYSQLSDRKAANETIISAMMCKREDSFKIFIESLRKTGHPSVLADIVDVLNLIFKSLDEKKNNNIGQGEDESPSYGSEASVHCQVSYYDRVTGQTFPIVQLDTTAEWRQSILGPSIPKPDTEEESEDRFVPVISIDLYDNKLGNDGANVLAQILENYNCIQELSIPKNCIDSDGVNRLATALQSNDGLVKFDVRLNTLRNGGAEHLAKALQRNVSLKSLNLTHTNLSHEGCTTLARTLSKNQILEELDMGFNDLSDNDCTAIANLLTTNKSLQKLRMRGNDITGDGTAKLSTAMKLNNTTLEVLDLSNNNIGDGGAYALSDMLNENTTLKILNLEKCGIALLGIQDISQSLIVNTGLLELDLSMNNIGDAGSSVISNTLTVNKTLASLSLNMCGICMPGFMSLLEALEGGTKLTTLKVCFNNIGRNHTVCTLEEDTSRAIAIVDPVYKRLQNLFFNRSDLKLLLWGNNLNERQVTKSDHVYKYQGDKIQTVV